jgi:hypothetical protein
MLCDARARHTLARIARYYPRNISITRCSSSREKIQLSCDATFGNSCALSRAYARRIFARAIFAFMSIDRAMSTNDTCVAFDNTRLRDVFCDAINSSIFARNAPFVPLNDVIVATCVVASSRVALMRFATSLNSTINCARFVFVVMLCSFRCLHRVIATIIIIYASTRHATRNNGNG